MDNIEISPNTPPPRTPDIDVDDTDYMITFLKMGLGCIPCIGSPLAELVGSTIPRQRLDRMAEFLKVLDQKLRQAETKLEKLSNRPEVADLVAKGGQAALAASIRRIEEIASLVKNGISADEKASSDHLLLLGILDQLDDVQMIMLTWQGHKLAVNGENHRFFEMHRDVLLKPIATNNSTSETFAKAALWEARFKKLLDLDLVREKTSSQRTDSKANKTPSKSYQISMLGRLLLRTCDVEFKDPILMSEM